MYILAGVSPGDDISEAARDALKLANKLSYPVRFKFNGVRLDAYPVSSTSIEDSVFYITNEYETQLKTIAGRIQK